MTTTTMKTMAMMVKKMKLQGDSGSPLVLPINGRFQVGFEIVSAASISKISTKY